MSDLLIFVSILVIIKNAIFYHIILQREFPDRPKQSFANVLSELWVQLPYVVFVGIIPTSIIYNFPGKKGFINDICSYIPLDQIVIYFLVLFIFAQIIMWLSIKIEFKSQYLEKFIDSSVSAFQGIFQAASGITITLSYLYAYLNSFSSHASIIGIYMFIVGLSMLMPSIFATNSMQYYKKLKSEQSLVQ